MGTYQEKTEKYRFLEFLTASSLADVQNKVSVVSPWCRLRCKKRTVDIGTSVGVPFGSLKEKMIVTSDGMGYDIPIKKGCNVKDYVARIKWALAWVHPKAKKKYVITLRDNGSENFIGYGYIIDVK